MGSSASVVTFKQIPHLDELSNIKDSFTPKEIQQLAFNYVSIIDSGKSIPSSYEIKYLHKEKAFKTFKDFLIQVNQNFMMLANVNRHAKQIKTIETIKQLSSHVNHVNNFILDYEYGRLEKKELEAMQQNYDLQAKCLQSLELFKAILRQYIVGHIEKNDRAQLLYIEATLLCLMQSHTEESHIIEMDKNEGEEYTTLKNDTIMQNNDQPYHHHHLPWSPTSFWIKQLNKTIFHKSITPEDVQEDLFYLDQTCCEIFRLRCELKKNERLIIDYLANNELVLNIENVNHVNNLGTHYNKLQEELNMYYSYRSFIFLFFHSFLIMLDHEKDLISILVEYLIPMMTLPSSSSSRQNKHRKKYLENVERKKKRKMKFKKNALLKTKHNLKWMHHVESEQKKRKENAIKNHLDIINQKLPGNSTYTMPEEFKDLKVENDIAPVEDKFINIYEKKNVHEKKKKTKKEKKRKKKKGYNDDENIKEDEIISAKKVIQKTEPIEYRMEYTEDEMKQIQLQQQMFENTPLPGDKNVDKLMKSM